MAIYLLGSMLDTYADAYLVMEINHLFVSSTLREEIWLLQKKNDDDFLQQLVNNAQAFNLNEVAGDRNFGTYSGGQKAILACLLMITAINVRNIHNLRILLINVFESISDETRRMLSAEFDRLRSTNGIRIFTTDRSQLRELTGS